MKLRIDKFTRTHLINVYLLILSIFCIYACLPEPKRTDKQTIIFSSYLLSEFDIIPSASEIFYFIIPSFACAGCKKSVASYFVKRQNRENSFLIVSDKAAQSLKNFNITKNVFIDKKNTIDRLNLDASNTTLIVWNKNAIQSITTITPENIDSLALIYP